MKPAAKDLLTVAPKYLGVPYSTLDCQAFVEKCLKDIGINKNLAGSNTWYREVMKNGWTGTPEECKKIYGSIPKGAFLFILSSNGKEPEQYKGDGIGNASHIGIYTGETASQMIEPELDKYEDDEARKAFVKKVSHGNGAIHSSQSRGCVCTSTFAGKAISGGWNRIGLWNALDYQNHETEKGENKKMTATVSVQTGSTVNLRTKPNTNSALIERIPNGAQVDVESESGNWAYVYYEGKYGYIMEDFLSFGEPPTDTIPVMITVPKAQLEAIYKQIGELLGEK